MNKYLKEVDIDNYIVTELANLGLKRNVDFQQNGSSSYMKEALLGGSKTLKKTGTGVLDVVVEKYKIPVIFENKVQSNKLIAQNKEGIKFDDNSIANYAVNGGLHYARYIISNNKYDEAIVFGVVADTDTSIKWKAYFVFGSGEKAFKELAVERLDFLESEASFNEFYHNAVLTEEEKHQILIDSQAKLQSYAKRLNKLMHNLNITAPQRVLYVSGMLLAMQNIKSADGVVPADLKGSQASAKRDGVQIINQIDAFLESREIPEQKQKLMLSSFKEISKDSQRDEPIIVDKEVEKLIQGKASTNKQIFTFIYHNIFLSIDAMAGHLDIMGEMYSEFLKYALGDGKEIGIVLTPPYITKMMATILNVHQESKVMDLAAGSAGFLISAMEMMIEDAERTFGKKTTQAEEKIKKIKQEQLLGIELNAEMFTLAATNMILRGDGSANIQKGNTFDRPEEIYTNFQATRLLLNPPFSFKENGMPFIAFGLDKMAHGGLGAIIIQDSAGSGKAIKTNKAILNKHTLIASIKMPMDLFQPMAGVQTSIYVFEAHKPHDFEKTVKFLDFRNDGYKRTKRSLMEIDNPVLRYSDIVKIYKAGNQAKVEANWNLESVYIEDFITDSGADWNFEQHQKIDIKPTYDDFRHTVANYLAWEVSQILKGTDIDF